ncbi:ABC transporter substrate-binding protein [Cohnella fermenti]|uniref:ABC transporter substrate-binding protein n=2 Tax=Cohnella fermenti TaxID=2565925 RepID=A0A4V3WFV1_9BACL|nr:ABC transporter substrate-binding protein [Cohnella fermenti]
MNIAQKNTGHRRSNGSKLAALAIAAVLALTACGESNGSNQGAASPSASSTASSSAAAEATSSASAQADEAATRMFKDWTGHEVEIPTHPQRVIFHSDTTGDIFALGVTPVGILKDNTPGTVFEEQAASVEDAGFPISAEKALQLQPDLIVFGNSDEAVYEQLSKVAPTVTFDSFASMEDRVATLGELLGKQEEAAAWVAQYKEQEAAMWKAIRESGVGENETASVVTMYPGNRLFVMLAAGLPQLLYSEGGFKQNEMVESSMKEELGFLEISAEKLPDYAGDRLFVLTPVAEDAQNEMSELMSGAVWKGLPAVKNGYVYEFPILTAGSDASSRLWLMEELPKVLANR